MYEYERGCIRQFAKGYSRQGAALVLLGKYKEAMRAYKKACAAPARH